MIFNSDGQIICTVVSGSVYTGVYAPNGSYNIVLNPGTSYTGRYHPCGAYNAVSVLNTSSRYASNGSICVLFNGSTYSLALPTGPTVVTATLSNMYDLNSVILQDVDNSILLDSK